MRLSQFKIGYFIIACIGLFLISSCKDDNQDPNPNRPPTAILESPVQNAVYNAREEIPIRLTISQDAAISSYRVLIRDQSNEELVFVLTEFSDSREIVVDTSVILEVSQSTTMAIEVRAEDSYGNQLDDTIGTFTLNPPLGNTFGLRFNLKYKGETLLMNKEYAYPTGEQFEFTRFDMFISNLSLISGGQETQLKDIDFLAMTNTYRNIETAEDGFEYTLAGLEDGNYDTVQFNIGLTPEQNATTPSDYPVSHPLGSGEYWGGWESYIFASIEGRINLDTSNPDFEQGIALHLGSDAARKEIALPIALNMTNNGAYIIDVSVELEDLFRNVNGQIYDIGSTPETHSLIHIPQVMELAENLKNSINN